MIEVTILNYLNENLENITAYMERPTNPSKSYVLIEKTGGGEENHIRHSTIAVKSIAESLYKAALLNEEVKDLMSSAISLDDIAKVELNSDYNFTDTSTKQYRYQAVFDITHY
jgi:hypothetical protein